jgi:hypothetical protein
MPSVILRKASQKAAYNPSILNTKKGYKTWKPNIFEQQNLFLFSKKSS